MGSHFTRRHVVFIVGFLLYIIMVLLTVLPSDTSRLFQHSETKLEPRSHQQSLTLNDSFYQAMSDEYNRLYNQVLESWFFIRTSVSKSDWQLQFQLYSRYRDIFAHMERFRDLLEPIRRRKAESLSKTVFQRILHLQNPKDCNSTKFAICHIDQTCGFGCQVHHVAYCLMISYAMGRTLHLVGKPWRYAPGMLGFEGLFQQIGNTDKCLDFIANQPVIEWDGGEVPDNVTVLHLPWIVVLIDQHKQPDIFPMAIPEDLADEMKSFHRQPFIWWVGIFLRYILRPLQSTCQSLHSEIERRFDIEIANFSSIKPLVGIHVRRTDKVGTEAQFHSFREYMKWVTEYFDQLEQKVGHDVIRSVYIASDEPSILQDAKREYPGYVFYHDPNIAQGAATWSRYSESSLNGILIDLLWLARSDYIVCTFSSNVCRLAYELMQTLHGDASDRFRSLDQMYFFWGQRNAEFEVVLPHVPNNKDEITLKNGDRLFTSFFSATTGNHFDGSFYGFNPPANQQGLFPAYKVREVIFTAKMMGSFYRRNANYAKTFQLVNDSCLLA